MTTISNQVRDAIFTRIQASNFASAFQTLQKTPPPTIEAIATPALGVFRPSEHHEPDGDYNVVPFRFKSTSDVAIMILVDANAPDVIDGVLDTYIDEVQDLILNDGTFMTLKTVDTNQPIIEGLARMTVDVDWPVNGSRYYGRATITMTFAYRCFFAVVPTVPLLEVDVTIPPLTQPTVKVTLPQS